MATARWRPVAAWACFGLAMLVVLLSSLTVWVRQQLMDTDNWVQASSELLADDEVRGAVSVYLVGELYDNVDVAAEIRRVLPAEYRPLSVPIAGATRDLAVRAADGILARPRVQTLWAEANRRAHTLFVAVVEERPVGALQVRADEVILDLRPLIVQLRASLGVSGQVPEGTGQVVIMSSRQIGTARTAVRTLNTVSTLAGLLSLALMAAAVWLSRERRAMLAWIGSGLVGIGVALLVIRRLAGGMVVDALVGSPIQRPVGADVWLVSTSLLRAVALGLMVYGTLILAGAWLAGRSRRAVWVRRRLAPVFRRPAWTYAGLALLLMLGLLAGPGDGGRTLAASLVLAVLVVAGVEVLRRRTVAEFPDPPAETGAA